jgi:DNA-binding NarL/FixJ family response regulator
MVRVLVVSPLPAVRAGLRALLGTTEGIEVVGEAERLEALGGLAGVAADVVVVDGEPEVEAGDGAAGALGPGVLILGPVPHEERLAAALTGRGWGYLPRSASADLLVAAIRAIASGLVVVDPDLGGGLLARARRGEPAELAESVEELTTREGEVLQLVALGLPNKTIAARLSISEHTVKFHVAAILAKLGAGSRTEAVHIGARRGLVVL